MNLTPTPETDENYATTKTAWPQQGDIDFARKLERERDDLREIFPRILEALESGACTSTCSVDFLREIPREVRLVRQRLERERDEAQTVIREQHAQLIGCYALEAELRNERDQLRKVCDELYEVHNCSCSRDYSYCDKCKKVVGTYHALPHVKK